MLEAWNKVTAVVLAGGTGTRLKPVVADRPKVLADVADKPFLAYQLDHFQRAGLRRVVLCVGYLADQVRREFGKRYGRLEVVYSEEQSPLGTGGALRQAVPHIVSPTALVANGDSYCCADLRSFWNSHLAAGAGASLLLVRVENAARYGRVDVDATGRVTAFAEKSVGFGPGWINAGVYLLAKSWLSTIPPDRPTSLEREVFPHWTNHGLAGITTEARFLDIGTPESYAQAEAFLRDAA